MYDYPELPKLITFTQLKEYYGIPRTSAYRYMQTSDFPKPIRLGAKSVRLEKAKVDEWLANRPTSSLHPDISQQNPTWVIGGHNTYLYFGIRQRIEMSIVSPDIQISATLFQVIFSDSLTV